MYDMDYNYHKCGRKRIMVPYESIANIQMGDKTCIRDLTSKLDLAPCTIWKMIKRGELNPHTNAMHPEISEEKKMVRIYWVLSYFDMNQLLYNHNTNAYMTLFI